MNYFFCVATMLALGMHDTFGFSVYFPFFGTSVLEADSIVSGTLSATDESVSVHVTDSIKGTHKVHESVSLFKNPSDPYFNPTNFATKLNGEECLVFGYHHEGGMQLLWSQYAVWPQGITTGRPWLSSLEDCMAFVTAILEYESMGKIDESSLVKRLVQDLQTDARRLFALEYLESTPRINGVHQKVFGNEPVNDDLRYDILRIAAAHIVKNQLFDDWTFMCVQRAYPVMPQTLMITYFKALVGKKGLHDEVARAQLRSIARLPPEIKDYATIESKINEMIPFYQQLDAKRNLRLFDSPHEAIAESASLVFSMIFNIPAPQNMTRAEEKVFWQTKMDEKQ